MAYENRMDAKQSVLIVDDSGSIQKYVKELLEESGFIIYIASNGRMGLEYIKSRKPDVVLLDIEMPGMTGLEMLDNIGRNERSYSIVIFSHLCDLQNRIAALENGADDYITKPIEPDELIVRVKVAARLAALKKELVMTKNALDGNKTVSGRVKNSHM